MSAEKLADPRKFQKLEYRMLCIVEVIDGAKNGG